MPAGVGGQMLQTLPLYIFLLFYPIMPYRFFFSLRFRPLFFFFFKWNGVTSTDENWIPGKRRWFVGLRPKSKDAFLRLDAHALGVWVISWAWAWRPIPRKIKKPIFNINNFLLITWKLLLIMIKYSVVV